MTSYILITLLTIFFITEMYFIGKLISVSNGIFENRNFTSFAIGSATWFFSSFVVLIPFLWINADILYYAIILSIKEFFTMVYLISRRDKLKDQITNYKELLFLVLGGIALSIIGFFSFDEIFRSNYITLRNDYHAYYYIVGSLAKVTGSPMDITVDLGLNTIASIIAYSIVSSIYLNISKRRSTIDYIISLVLTIGIMILFNNGQKIYGMLGLFYLLLAMFFIYNLIMFSRRRYASLFGMLAFVSWGIDPDVNWPLVVIGLTFLVVYAIFRKNNIMLFSLQVISPVLIISTLWIMDYSTIIGWLSLVTGVFMYSSVFFFGRIKTVERGNKLLEKINYLISIILTLFILILAIVIGVTTDVPLSVLWTNNELFFDFGDIYLNSILNAAYWGLLFALLFYVALWFSTEKILKWKLWIVMSFFIIVLGFNPATKIILNNFLFEGYQYMSFIAVPPIIIVAVASIRNVSVKLFRLK